VEVTRNQKQRDKNIFSPNISVLTAVFDTPVNDLNQSLASVLSKRYVDFEFITVDDGFSLEINHHIVQLARCDERIHVHRLRKHVGRTKALNISSSDCWLSEALLAA
jgi:hypothetical protein